MTEFEDLSIDEAIRPNPVLYVQAAKESLDQAGVLFKLAANEKDYPKTLGYVDWIQAVLAELRGLAKMQEKQFGEKKLSLYMDVLIQRTPYSRPNRRIALFNAREPLMELMSSFLHDVDVRKKLIEELKKQLKRASLSEKITDKIMNEVYGKLKELSGKMLEIVLRKEDVDLFRAEVAIGYLVLIPTTTEEEINVVAGKLLSVSPDYLALTIKYRQWKLKDKFQVQVGDWLVGIYDEESRRIFFAAQVKALESGKIICEVSLGDPYLDPMKMEFSSKTGRSIGYSDYLLLKPLNFTEAVISKDTKPSKGKIEDYSVKVALKWRRGEREEKVSIGYYDFGRNEWLIPRRDGISAVGVYNSCVMSWTKVPEVLEVPNKA